ncbi:MAG TPA: cache domain-containing protein, partial [Anaerolineales bacterium]|nr:cache domain-containing protein [Anaerolineales bacterium]
MANPAKTTSLKKEADQTLLPHTPKMVRSFRRFKRFSIFVTSMIALVPLAILTIFIYHADQKAFDAENRFAITQIVSNTKHTLELLVEERRASLTLLINEQGYEGFRSTGKINRTLKNLKTTVGGYIDLGLIESDGTQYFYSGPYDFTGKNYKDQAWFHEVSLRGVYVSDVFMGFRNFPHFVIAVKDEKDDGDFYVLRATIDMDMIKEKIFSLYPQRSTDVFIINKDGILQTPSAFNGDVLEKVKFEVPPYVRNMEVIEQLKQNGARVTFGHAYIEQTPFILIAIKYRPNPFSYWLSYRSDLLTFLLFLVILILAIIYWRASYLVKALRSADQQRARTFHAIEYTNKMATIGRMAASVAHEINNPLAIINEKAGLIKDMATYMPNFPKQGKTLELVDSIHKSVERCSSVTHRLLGFARRMDVKKELIDLEHLMIEVIGFLGKEAIHRNIDIKCNFPKDLPAIESD